MDDELRLDFNLASPEGRTALRRARELLAGHAYETLDTQGRKPLISSTTASVTMDLVNGDPDPPAFISRIAYLVHAQSFLSTVLVHMIRNGQIPAGSDDEEILRALFAEIDRWLEEEA